MKFVIFETEVEQAEGLHGFDKIPRDTIFIFPNVGGSRIIETDGFKEDIIIGGLDRNMNKIHGGEFRRVKGVYRPFGYWGMLHANARVEGPARQQHLVELAQTPQFIMRPEIMDKEIPEILARY